MTMGPDEISRLKAAGVMQCLEEPHEEANSSGLPENESPSSSEMMRASSLKSRKKN